MAKNEDDRLIQIEYSTRNPLKTQGAEMGPALVALILIFVGCITYPVGVLFWVLAVLALIFLSPSRPRL